MVVAPVGRDRVEDTVATVGEVFARNAATVTSEVSGRVTEVPVADGSQVEAGEVIVRLDDAREWAALAAGKARADEAALKTVEAEVTRRGSRSSGGAPPGIPRGQPGLPRRRPRHGGRARDRARAAHHPAAGPAALALPRRARPRRRGPGRLAGLPGRELRGAAAAIDPAVDWDSRNFTAEADLDDPARRLRPGLFLDATVVLAVREGALVVPDAAALFEGPTSYVFGVDGEGRARRTSTTYAGASAAVVERDATEIIEENLNGIDGVEQIVSTTRDGLSQIDVEFELGRDLYAAAADVRDRVGAVGADLPEDIEPPVIAKTSADEDAMMWITLTSEVRDTMALTDFAERNLADVLGVVPGVAQVQIGGEKLHAMRVWLDPAALSARGLTVPEGHPRVQAENVELLAGELRTAGTAQTVRTDTRFDSVEDFERLVLRDGPGGQVLLGDVARSGIGPEEDQRSLLANGRPAIGLGVIRQSGSNVLAVADGVRAELDRLASVIPDDIRMSVSFDESVFVRGVAWTLVITSGLVVAVVFLFLGSLRGTLIPAATIPISLAATFVVLALFGFSINMLTLLALVLAIGLVVDDSIVVLENVTRHREEGEPGLLSAVNGTREVGLAVVATTLVLVSVFVPLAFRDYRPAVRRVRGDPRGLDAVLDVRRPDARGRAVGRLVRTKEEEGTGWLARGIDRVSGFLERGYLAALFESFVHPLTVMLTVPLALAGGLGALVVAGQSFNTSSQIALLLLTGLLAKNAILIVDFANQRRARGDGIDARGAALEAARTRFRPILMTSISTFFGGVPLPSPPAPAPARRAGP